MSDEQRAIPEPPPERRRWWLWGLIVLIVLLAVPAVGDWWWRMTTAWKSEAHALADQGRYEDAITLLDRVMWLSPDPDDRNGSYAVRASFYAKSGDLEQAIEDMDLAVAWSQEHKTWLLVPHVVTRGLYKMEADRIDDAVSDFDLALQLADREDAEWRERLSHFAAIAHYYRGRWHRLAGRQFEAEKDVRAAEELDPEWVATVAGASQAGPE